MPNPCDLRRGELDILSILVERSRCGADVYRELCDQYADSPNRSTVYNRLDGLSDDGLVEKRSRPGDARSKVYHATEAGKGVIRKYAADITVRVQSGEMYRR